MESIRATPARRKWWWIALGPALGVGLAASGLGGDPKIAAMAGIAAWMAAWWISEAVPIAVTALLPLVLLPATRIAPVADVAVNYSRSTIFLFLGGFLIALGLQHSGAHRRVALFIVHKVGSRPRRLVLGFMIATWLLSMWISNTSTTMLMLPIALSVFATARDQGADERQVRQLAIAVLLGVAYAANMGGMATLIGTPPNLAFARLFVQLFREAPAVSFLDWMLLTRVAFPLAARELLGGRAAIDALRRDLGPVRRDERLASSVFAVTALLWISSSSVDVGELHLTGWRELLGWTGYVDDAVVAVTMAVVLFLLPSQDRPGERLLEWSMAQEVPWGVLLLFGGGFALATGFTTSGLSAWAGLQFEVLAGSNPWVVVAVVCVMLTLLTELTSNIATTEMFLPILAEASIALAIDPRLLMIPATLSASCAFMMPVATPPAAIVFGSGLVPIRSMVRAGIFFNILGVVLVMLVLRFVAIPVLGIDITALPSWAGNR